MMPRKFLVVWSSTEDFFWDDEFKDFLAHYSPSGSTTLITSCDLFDSLKVLEFSTPEEMHSFGISERDIQLFCGAVRERVYAYYVPGRGKQTELEPPASRDSQRTGRPCVAVALNNS